MRRGQCAPRKSEGFWGFNGQIVALLDLVDLEVGFQLQVEIGSRYTLLSYCFAPRISLRIIIFFRNEFKLIKLVLVRTLFFLHKKFDVLLKVTYSIISWELGSRFFR